MMPLFIFVNPGACWRDVDESCEPRWPVDRSYRPEDDIRHSLSAAQINRSYPAAPLDACGSRTLQPMWKARQRYSLRNQRVLGYWLD